MRSSHGIQPVFDDANLVSCGGLPAVMALAERAGLSGLLREGLSVDSPNAAKKATSVVAGMLAGADDIDGLDVLRAGGNDRVLGRVLAPSTLGTFLRSFTHGHALQLGTVNRHLLGALARMVPSLIADQGPVLIDLDDTMREVHGYQKQAVAYGYDKSKGLNAILATASTPASAPVVLVAGLRRGNIRSGAHAGWYAARALSTVKDLAADREMLLRADSAFCLHEVVAAAQKAGAAFSVTIPAWKSVTSTISQIPETAWIPIRYPHAVWDEEGGQWISDAEVAEMPFTLFVSRRKAQHVTCRLVVRRVKRLGGAPAGQEGLFDTFRYHAFVTDSTLDKVAADQRHRHHAVVEQVIAELKSGPLAHLPSGRFCANQAWLGLAVIAFNLSRAAAHAAGMGKARMATLRTRLISLPARIASSARRLALHLPKSWPWQHAYMRLWNTSTSPPPAAPR